jgi:hypothetical protein
MAKLSRIALLSLWSYAALSVAVTGAGQAQQREARLVPVPLRERPMTLASCDQARFKQCLDAAMRGCAASAGNTCPNPEEQCKALSGC